MPTPAPRNAIRTLRLAPFWMEANRLGKCLEVSSESKSQTEKQAPNSDTQKNQGTSLVFEDLVWFTNQDTSIHTGVDRFGSRLSARARVQPPPREQSTRPTCRFAGGKAYRGLQGQEPCQGTTPWHGCGLRLLALEAVADPAATIRRNGCATRSVPAPHPLQTRGEGPGQTSSGRAFGEGVNPSPRTCPRRGIRTEHPAAGRE